MTPLVVKVALDFLSKVFEWKHCVLGGLFVFVLFYGLGWELLVSCLVGWVVGWLVLLFGGFVIF